MQRYPLGPFRRLLPRLLCSLLALALLAGCAKTYVLTGRVLDAASGTALAGAEVASAASRVRSDEQGAYRLSVPADTHEVQVSLPGYVTQVLGATVSEEAPGATLDVSLQRRTLGVRVTDAETGVPVADAAVRLGDQTAATDAQGACVMDAVALGALEVSAAGYTPHQRAQAEVEALFDLASGAPGEVSVALAPRALEGLVTDAESGAPLAGVVVAADERRQATSGADGRYRLLYVTPGESLSFQAPEGPVAYRAAEMPCPDSGVLDASLTPWRLTLSVLRDEDGAPLEGATVEAGLAAATTDAAGQATLSAAPGATVTVASSGRATLTLTYGGEERLEARLARSELAGLLTEAGTGNPVAGGLVLVYTASGGEEPVLVRSADDGRFRLEGVQDAERVIVKVPGYRRVELAVADPSNVAVALEPFEFRGVYVPYGLLAVPEEIMRILDLVQETGMNGIVVDVKGDWARIAWDSPHPVAREIGAYSEWVQITLPELLEECHQRGIYVVGRIVVFKDDLLATTKPEWAVMRAAGGLYKDNEGLAWADPFLPEVQEYNISLAREVALMGFDEVQLDYLRFPSDGSGILSLVYSQDANYDTRIATMAAFCRDMYDAISRTPAFLSADIFGLTPWVDPGRDMGIGQRVDDIAPHMDYVSPMLYPTTFGPGNLGYNDPGMYPYEVVYHSVLKTRERTSTLCRPWLQFYAIGHYRYGTREYLEQRKGAEDAGSHGWIWWNAAGKYEPDALYPDAIAQHPDLPTPPPPEE